MYIVFALFVIGKCGCDYKKKVAKAHVPPPPYGQNNALKKYAADSMSIDLT
jgi:hypothetical protein